MSTKTAPSARKKSTLNSRLKALMWKYDPSKSEYTAEGILWTYSVYQKSPGLWKARIEWNKKMHIWGEQPWHPDGADSGTARGAKAKCQVHNRRDYILFIKSMRGWTEGSPDDTLLSELSALLQNERACRYK